jgi:hypothetical protein
MRMMSVVTRLRPASDTEFVEHLLDHGVASHLALVEGSLANRPHALLPGSHSASSERVPGYWQIICFGITMITLTRSRSAFEPRLCSSRDDMILPAAFWGWGRLSL